MAGSVNNEQNTVHNISKIESVLKAKRDSVSKTIAEYRKILDSARKSLDEKYAEFLREAEEREALEAEKLRAEKEKEEAIKEATATPIVPEEQKAKAEDIKAEQAPPEEKAEPVKVTETALPEQKPEVKEIKKAPSDTAKVTVVAEEEPLSKQRLAAKSAAESIINKNKKPVITKPVIKTYIPPAEEPRQRRYGDRPQGAPGQGRRPQGGSSGSSVSFRQSAIDRINNAPLPQAGGNAPKKKVADNRPEDKTRTNKKAMTKKGYVTDGAVVEYDEMGEIKKIRTRKTGAQKKEFTVTEAMVIDHAVFTKENFTVKELAEKIGKAGAEIIKRLFQLGIMKTINDNIDFETAELVANDLGISIELQKEETSEEKLISYFENEAEDDPSCLKPRPPIVTIMGHVDHGKTSILDYIKKSNVAAGEAGGITQHISAYTTTVNGRPICFLDTPGHAAFTAMRARGANVTDIVVIVVAADDGIMPQTVEVINHCKAAGVKIIVAINKIDKTGADVERVKSQLTEYDLLAEEWGGDIPVVPVSAKTGANMDLLLENILTVADIMELTANPDRKARGTVVEARLDKGKGPIATVLVQNGTLSVGDHIVAGTVIGKVRAMQDDKGRNVKKAGPSMAVAILGLDEVPDSGDQLMAVDDEKLLKSVVAERIARDKEKKLNSGKITLDDVFRGIEEGKLKDLNIIIKADVQGSVEAIRESLTELSTDEVRVRVAHAMVGAINESDVALADSINAIIIGFNVRPHANAKAAAEAKKVEIRLYRVIYDAINDVKYAIKGLSAPKYKEQYLGKAEVRAIYKISGVGTIAGCMVLDGKIVKNAKVRLIRDNVVVADTAIDSLKRMKDNVKEVVSGYECGIGLANCNDILEGDIIESFEVVEDRS